MNWPALAVLGAVAASYVGIFFLARRRFNFSLLTLSALGVGIVIGLAGRGHSEWIEPIGRIYINLLLASVAPLVVVSIIASITSLGSLEKLKTVGLRSFGWLMVTNVIAVILTLGVAISLGGDQAGPFGAGHVAPHEIDVGFFSGFENAEFGINRGKVGDQPLRVRPRAALKRGRLVPRGPAVAFRQAVGGVPGIFGLEPWQVPVALNVALLVVVELAALLTVVTAAGDSVVVGVCAVAHGWCSSGRMWSRQG